MRLVILLTSCINPRGMSQTVLQDFGIREKQISESIKFYLQKTSLKIIIVDNSNFDFSKIENLFNNGRLEFLSFDGNNYDKRLGKGYGESEILKYAIANSLLIKHSDYIIKISGRYQVININTLIADLYLLPKKQVVISYLCNGFFDSRIFACTSNFLTLQFLPKHTLIDESQGVYFETIFNICITSQAWRPFLLTIPSVSGVSGTTGGPLIALSPKKREYWQKFKLNWQKWLCYE